MPLDNLSLEMGVTQRAPIPEPLIAQPEHSVGASLPPMQGAQNLTQSEMRVLSGNGGAPSRWSPPVASQERRETGDPSIISQDALDELRKEVSEDLGTLDTKDALDAAVRALDDVGGGNGTPLPSEAAEEAFPGSESASPAAPAGATGANDAAARQESARKAREIAARRTRDRLSGIQRRGKPMSDDDAASDPGTFRFPSIEELDADVPLPW